MAHGIKPSLGSLILFCIAGCTPHANSPAPRDKNIEFYLQDSVRIILNTAESTGSGFNENARLVLYALPNGNSIEWTMGKRLLNDDDWHVDIQHILAQTNWLRNNTNSDWEVAYLEAPMLSWPSWKRAHTHSEQLSHKVVDSLRSIATTGSNNVVLSSHSGGGAFINSFIESADSIPDYIDRINYIDSNYGYNESIGIKLINWLRQNDKNKLVVLAYNDSIALYQGRPFVSAKGGTWYRTKMMLADLSKTITFDKIESDSLLWYRSVDDQALIVFKKNPDRGIYHTEQVELNGFIMSMLFATSHEIDPQLYFGDRLYDDLILESPPVITNIKSDSFSP